MKKNTLFILLSFICSISFAAKEQVIWNKASSSNKLKSGVASPYSMQRIPTPTHSSKAISADENIHYQQTYKGLPIFGHILTVHQQINKPSFTTGTKASEIEKDLVSLDPVLSQEAAEKIIFEGISEPIGFKKTLKVIYIDETQRAHLAYHISYYVTKNQDEKPNAPNVMMDANTGEILRQWNGLPESSAVGQGPGGNPFPLPYRSGAFQYGQALPGLPSLGKFDVDVIDGQCFVQNTHIRVVHLDNMNLGYDAFPITVSTEDSKPYTAYSYPCSSLSSYLQNTDANATPTPEALSPINDTMYFSTATIHMYQTIYGVEKPLGDDLPVRAFTHLGQIDNAFAIPTIRGENGEIIAHQQIIIGNGDQFFSAPSQTVVAHELSHNFTDINSGLIYDGQSGAINEAFSDMAAMALEDYLHQDYPWYWDGEDWSIGREATMSGRPLRYMDEPSKDGISISNATDYYDKMDVHFGSGVFNKAFYLLAHQPGWSIQKAFQVMVDANQHYWSPIADYNFAACGVIQAAIDRHYDANSVINAFKGVQVTCPIELGFS